MLCFSLHQFLNLYHSYALAIRYVHHKHVQSFSLTIVQTRVKYGYEKVIYKRTTFASYLSPEVARPGQLRDLTAECILNNTTSNFSAHVSNPGMQGGTIRMGNSHHHKQPFRHVMVDDNNSTGYCPLRQVGHPLLHPLLQTLRQEPCERPPFSAEQEQEKVHVIEEVV